MLRYKEFEHTADIGLEIYGSTLENLFQNAGYAMFDTIADAAAIHPAVERTVQISGDDEETLLMNWLRELLYHFSVYEEIYAEFDIRSLEGNELTAIIKGERLDIERHRFNTELKAVTYHQFQLLHEHDHWRARVIFDV